MKKLSRRDRSVLLAGGGITVVVLLAFYVILPFYDSLTQVEGNLVQKKELLAQAVQTIQNKNVYLKQLEELDSGLVRYRSQLLDTDDPTMAQNQLENMVRVMAEENGINISRSTPLQPKKVGEQYSRVTVQINVTGGMLELANFLHAVSMHPKFLEVEDFYVNGFRVRNQIRLQPRMNISGFIRLPVS